MLTGVCGGGSRITGTGASDMPTYQFKCESCGDLKDREMSVDEVEESLMLPCKCFDAGNVQVASKTRHKRVYSFGLAPVKGAGGTPGRFGSR